MLRNQRIKWCGEGVSHYNGSVTGGEGCSNSTFFLGGGGDGGG